MTVVQQEAMLYELKKAGVITVDDYTPFPKPYCLDPANVKAIYLGCDPTNTKYNNRFEYVFALPDGKGSHFERFVTGHRAQLESIGLTWKQVYVQNLCQNYFTVETSKNKRDWLIAAHLWVSELEEELKEINPHVAVLLTSELLLPVLLKDEKSARKAVEYYACTAEDVVPIPAELNKLGRPLFPLYRHPKYRVSNWKRYTQLVRTNVDQIDIQKTLTHSLKKVWDFLDERGVFTVVEGKDGIRLLLKSGVMIGVTRNDIEYLLAADRGRIQKEIDKVSGQRVFLGLRMSYERFRSGYFAGSDDPVPEYGIVGRNQKRIDELNAEWEDFHAWNTDIQRVFNFILAKKVSVPKRFLPAPRASETESSSDIRPSTIKERWGGTLKEAGFRVKELYGLDKEAASPKYASLKDASDTFFDQHTFPKYPDITKERFVENVRKA